MGNSFILTLKKMPYFCYPDFCKVTALLEHFTRQLILPDAMKVFPIYMNSLLKTPALVGSTELSTDDRSFYRFLVNAMGVEETQVLLYPRLIPLVSYTHIYHFSHWHQTLRTRVHVFALSLSLSAHYGCVQQGDPGSSALLRGAAQRVRHLPAGKRALHVPLAGTACPPDLIQNLFNVPSLGHLSSEGVWHTAFVIHFYYTVNELQLLKKKRLKNEEWVGFYHRRVVVFTHCQHTFMSKHHVKVDLA